LRLVAMWQLKQRFKI